MMGRRQLSLRLARRARTRAFLPFLEQVEDRVVLSTFYVTNTGDNLGVNPAPGAGTGTLRQAIIDSNASTQPTSEIDFAIPASTGPGLDVPVPGFDPATQDWTIALDSPLPPITHPVTIDGYSQAEFPIPYVYPLGGAIETLAINGNPTGGTFTLMTSTPLPPATTTLPYNATANQIGGALQDIVGVGNVTVAPGAVPNTFIITFEGLYAGDAIPLLVATSNLTGGTNPSATITGTPVEITSSPNAVTAIDGNNAHARVIIDGYTQELAVQGSPTGGTFTLTSSTPGYTGTTVPIPYNADAATVQAALESVFTGNVAVEGGPAPGNPMTIYFTGQLASQIIAPLTADSSGLSGGVNPAVTITALTGTGFVVDASHSTLRGLIIDGFGVGVSVPHLDASGNPNVGDLILGNFIGTYFVYPVDPNTGFALPSPNNVAVEGIGNSLQGVLLDSNNTTVGGTNPEENNVISGNGQEGVLIQADATGDGVEGNQIGLMGPSTNGLYYIRGNGAEGVVVLGSSDQIGGPTSAAGNLISGNASNGIRISGPVATRTIVAANIIGLGPGGGYAFGTGNPGNGDAGDGILIEDSALNQIGGPTPAWGNVISSNFGAGVSITGGTSTGNTILNNLIGVTADGGAAKGNAQEGVANDSPGTVIGPGNVISGNLLGVLISGPSATGVVVQGNLIGTDSTGTLDLGNAEEGVLIDNASDNTVTGNANGSQVISGNLVGVAITSSSPTLPPSSLNLVSGNFIGSDKSGLNPLPNAQQGVLIDSANGNTIGGTTAAARNLISANNTGVLITGSSASSNVVQGNYIGTDISGTSQLPNETDGVVINMAGSGNLIGGSSTSAGNVIAFNPGDGVLVDTGIFNSILTNSIFSNGGQGIELIDDGNHNQPAPVLTSIQSVVSGTTILGTVQGTPSTPYTVQFFSNAVSGPEGKTFLGQVSVTTNTSGVASFTANLSAALDPTQPYITATATSASGDTSEFSTSGTAAPLTVEFAMASYTVSQSAGTATITVVRSSDDTAASVAYATSDGTAMAGVDYVTASGVLSFAVGQTEETFTVSIIDTQQVGGSRFLNLTLSDPTNGMELGSPSTATLTILGFTSSGPTVLSVQPVLTARGITAVVLTFSEPLDPSRAVNLLNYSYSLQAAGKDGQFGTADDILFGIASATYNPSNDSVTLHLAHAIHCNSFIRLTINQATDNATVPIGVADTSGNLLDAYYDGVPGGVFIATFARGQQLSYPDGNGNVVSLSLSRGGTMILTRQANGNAWQLSIPNAVPDRTTLTGRVRKAGPSSTGLTPSPSILTTGIRDLLTDPPFTQAVQPLSINVVNPAPRKGTPIHGGQARPSARPLLLRRSFGAGPRRSPV